MHTNFQSNWKTFKIIEMETFTLKITTYSQEKTTWEMIDSFSFFSFFCLNNHSLKVLLNTFFFSLSLSLFLSKWLFIEKKYARDLSMNNHFDKKKTNWKKISIQENFSLIPILTKRERKERGRMYSRELSIDNYSDKINHFSFCLFSKFSYERRICKAVVSHVKKEASRENNSSIFPSDHLKINM